MPSIETETQTSVVTDINVELVVEMSEESCTIIHAVYTTSPKFVVSGWWVNVHPETYLINTDGEKLQMIHAENIVIHPLQLAFSNKASHRFTMIFPKIPSTWECFDFMELLSSPLKFYVPKIKRNDSAIYNIKLSYPF